MKKKIYIKVMKKNTIKLTESDLKRIISESVKRVLKEGTSDSHIYDTWEELKMTIGAETMLDCIYNWSSSDEISQWLEWFEEEDYI
jgi:hypothetical protein